MSEEDNRDDNISFSSSLLRFSKCKTRDSLVSCLLDLRVRASQTDTINSNQWSELHAVALRKRRSARGEWTSGVNSCYRMLCEYKREITVKQLSCDAKLKETTASALPSIDRIAIPSVSFKIDDRGRKYAVYVIRVECSNDEDYVVQRRFREFCSLHERLEQKYPEISLRDLNLRLPRKIMGQIMGQFSKRMLSLRRKALMEYLTTLSSVQIRGKQLEDLQEFLDLRHHIQNETSSSSVPLHHHHHHHHTRERSSSDNNSNTSLTKLTVPTKMTYDVSRICEGKDFESTMQNILHGAVGSESQKLRDYVRKFTNAWQQHRQQKPQLNNNSNDLKFFESTRNFVSVLSSDISKRFEPSLSRAIQNDSNNKDLLEDAVYRVVESAIMKQIGSQLETIAMTFVAEQDMKTLAWIDVLQRGGLPLPIKSDLFGIRTCFQSSKTWYRDAIEILNSLDKISLPSDMLRAIMRFTESILMEAREVSNGVEHVTADDLVPIMIYAVASSSLEHPHTTLMLIRHLSSPNLCRGEAEYYLTVFESVLFYLSSGVKEGDAVHSSTNKINDAIVDLRTPRRVQSRRLLGALSFDLNVEIKSFEQNPLRVWVHNVNLKYKNSKKSRFRKTIVSTFHIACMLMNTSSSSSISKRRHEICFVNRTQSDLELLQDKTEKWIRESLSSSKHHDDIDLRLPTLPRDLSSNLAPHALSRRLRNANIRDNKKNPDESLRSTFTRYFRGKRKGDTGSSNMTTTQILATHGQEVEQHIKLLIKSIHRACVDKKISASFPPSFLREFLGLTSTSSRKK